MAIVIIDDPITKKKINYYMDGTVKEQIDNFVIPALNNDSDKVAIIAGREGSGKSLLSFQLAKYVDPTFCLDRVCFTTEEFQAAIINSKKGQAVVLDEAFRGYSSSGALSEVNKKLMSLIQECRQKCLFIILVLPSVHLLTRYIPCFRASFLINVYIDTNTNKRGRYVVFFQEKMKLVYIKGKQFLNMNCVKADLIGQFRNIYPINEMAYRRKKSLSLREEFVKKDKKSFQDQRNKLIYLLHKHEGYSTPKLEELFKEYGINIKTNQIGKIVRNIDDTPPIIGN